VRRAHSCYCVLLKEPNRDSMIDVVVDIACRGTNIKQSKNTPGPYFQTVHKTEQSRPAPLLAALHGGFYTNGEFLDSSAPPSRLLQFQTVTTATNHEHSSISTCQIQHRSLLHQNMIEFIAYIQIGHLNLYHLW
jgi:hypothetical protein